MLKKKKRGSALITVIIVMTILIIVGTTILTVTTVDYNMRRVESGRIENLYLADSGLNIVENIIKQANKNAIQYADLKIREEILKEEANISNENLQKEFNKYFYEYLNQTILYEKSSESIPLLKYLILEKKYIDTSSVNKLKFEEADKLDKVDITIDENSYQILENLILIDVKSDFESKEKDLKNERTVQVTYKITPPLYNSEVEKFDIYPVFDNKAFSIDGNLNISLTKENLELKETNIKGDIWVKGEKDSTDYGIVFDKYDSGIFLNNTVFNLDGNLYTSETFRLSSNVESSLINGDVYANNFYIGNLSNELESENNKIKIIGDVVLNNDLALNSINSEIKLGKDFYGINDKKLLEGNLESYSSSIIVNNSENSTINIKGDSYISGVAYLDATDLDGNKYQTGESVAIKGNYLAYTDVEINENTVLKYYSPLQLLEPQDNDSSLKIKAEYFKNYYDESNVTNKNDLKNGGITFGGNVYSTGAYIKENKVGYDDSINLKQEELIEKKKEFAKNIFYMEYAEKSIALDKAYSNGIVEKTVSNQIDFLKISGESFIGAGDKYLILVGSSEDITIDNNEVTINGDKKGYIKEGIIISNGDIEIKNSFNFKGTIITSKNVSVNGSKDIDIKYDNNVVKEVVLKNKNILQGIFKTIHSNKKGEEINLITNSNLYENSDNVTVSKWKIIK